MIIINIIEIYAAIAFSGAICMLFLYFVLPRISYALKTIIALIVINLKEIIGLILLFLVTIFVLSLI